MTRRDHVRDSIIASLTEQSISYENETSEYREQLDLHGTINGRSVHVVVDKYPADENPETYEGAELWTVQLFDEDGQELNRLHNPEPSLDLAVTMIDWDSVREALA